MDRIVIFFLGVAVGVFGFVGLTAALHATPRDLMNEAVKRGHAEYYIDKDYERQWRWK